MSAIDPAELAHAYEHQRPGILAAMDDALLDIAAGRDVDVAQLRRLPPWRAVLIATVAVRCGAMSFSALDELTADAQRVGGAGTLPGAKR